MGRKLLTVAQYAAHRKARGMKGGSRAAVYKALEKGWFYRESNGKVDSDKADAGWGGSSRPRIDDPRPKPAPVPAGSDAGPATPGDPEVMNEDDYYIHRARREKEAADKLAIANAQKRGELVDRAAVESAWQSLGVLIRERLSALPARLASRVAHCDDEHQVTLLMRVEVEAVLNELGDEAPGVTK